MNPTTPAALRALACAVLTASSPAAETLLFVDDHEILYRAGTRASVRTMEKFSGNPVLTPDNPERPWEKSIQWVSVHRDPATGRMQMWYQAFSGKGAEDKRFKSVVAYAESTDGITWLKPKLTLFPYRTRGFDVAETNIVLVGTADGYGDRYANSVVVDAHEPDPSRRYKMAFYDWNGGPGAEGGAGLCVAFSPDGIHWTRQGGVRMPVSFGSKTMQPPFVDEHPYLEVKGTGGRVVRHWRIPQSLSDAVDALWDPRLRRYIVYGKMWVPGPDGGLAWKHGMGRSESTDFLEWSKPQLLLTTDERDPWNLEFHTTPVFIHEGVYLSLNQLFTRENGTIDTELITSRDGVRWERNFRRQPVIVRGGKKSFDAGFLLTNGNPVAMGDELWFYYGGNRGLVRFPNPPELGMPARTTEFASGIGIAKIKRDRFVGIAPDPRATLRDWSTNDPARASAPRPNTVGQLTLKPRDLSKVRRITVNADASHGELRAEILTEDGFRIRGFAKDDAIPLKGDSLAHALEWRGGQPANLPPGPHLLRLHLDSAEVFSVTLH